MGEVSAVDERGRATARRETFGGIQSFQPRRSVKLSLRNDDDVQGRCCVPARKSFGASNMKSNIIRQAVALGLWLLGCALVRAADTTEVNIFKTNQSTRVVTNVIEVLVPNNVFVTEYRTSRVDRTLTNVVDVAVTNWTLKTVTNAVAVNAVQTNFVKAFQTNQATLTLTNWETVVVTKTNWVRQPMTNVIDFTLPAETPVAAKTEASPAPAKTNAPAAEAKADSLVIETSKTRTTEKGEVEVQFKVRLASSAEEPLRAQWRVERVDGAILFFNQNQEFKRVLPPGHYQMIVKARRDADAPVLTAQGSMDVTRTSVALR